MFIMDYVSIVFCYFRTSLRLDQHLITTKLLWWLLTNYFLMSRKRKSAIDLWDESGRNVPKPIEVVEEEMREPEPEPQGEPVDMDDIEDDDDSED